MPEPRLLVDLEPHAVPDRMPILVAVSGLLDGVAGGPIDLLARHPGSDGLDPRLLSQPHHLVYGSQPGRRFPERNRPGHVGVVPVHHAAEVDLDQVAMGQFPADRPVVGLGAVLPERHDGVEGGGLRTQLPHGHLQVEGHRTLGHALDQLADQNVEGPVGDVLGRGQRCPLFRILRPSEPLHLVVGRHQLDAGGRQGRVGVIREAGRLESHPRHSQLGARLGEPRGEVPRVDAPLQVGHLPPGLLGVPAVGEEDPATSRQEQLAVRPGEAGQVADVGEPGDQERIGLHVGEPAGQTEASGSMVHGGR